MIGTNDWPWLNAGVFSFIVGARKGEAVMTDDNKPPSRSLPPETTEGAMDEYQAKQKAELAKIKLRELRLARDAGKAKGKKAKR